MNIKTWQERWDTLGIPKDMAIQAEIDELRAALQERDVEIEHLRVSLKECNAELSARARLLFANEIKLAAQRKVLVQEDKRAQLFGMQPPAYCAADIQEQRKQCWCTTCRPITVSDMRFVVCPDCGNKRCPKAHNHTNACTDSNEPGQVGSSWEHVAPQQAQDQRKPLTRSEKNRIWSSCSDATTLSARASLFGTKVEQHHGIKDHP